MSLPTLAPKYSFDGSSIHRSSQAGSKRQMNGSVVSSHAEERQTIGKMSKASKHSTAAGTESVRLNHLHDPEMSSIVAFVENKQREVYANQLSQLPFFQFLLTNQQRRCRHLFEETNYGSQPVQRSHNLWQFKSHA